MVPNRTTQHISHFLYLESSFKWRQGLIKVQMRLQHQNLMQVRIYTELKFQSNIYCKQAHYLQQTLANIITLHLLYTSSLVIMVDQERKQCNFCFEAICSGPKASNWQKCLILSVTVLLVGEECLVKSAYVVKNSFIKAILL